ncbi:hypothetical protein [Porphyromonas macacae]|uniref:hypothetical protein n=1 Tax=Porphyromonas macacae TaxID=28115 RepID=UPI0024AD5841|nr:hypothetical protein [Porphyromonas macacae]
MIFYSVANHSFCVETSNNKLTAQLLPSFSSFVSLPTKRILFKLSGNTKIDLPGRLANDTFKWNGILYEVYEEKEYKIITMQLGGKKHTMRTASNWTQLSTDLTLTDLSERQFLNNFIIVGFGMASAALKTLKIHASVTEKDGKALLFLGTSGTGKSTHSRLWKEYVPGCTLLNDDEPVIRIDKNGVVWVYGSPWSGKTPCYRNERARVAGFVHLYQSSENKLTLLKGRDAFASIFSSCCMMRTDTDNKNKVFNTVADLLEHVPVYKLNCRPDEEAVSLTRPLIDY